MIQISISPVFIGGCERSGTTLLGAMLGAHSECLCTPQSQFKIEVLRHINLSDGLVDRPSALDRIRNHWRFKLWGIDIGDASIYDQEVVISYPRLIEKIVSKYGEHIGKKDYRLWIDQTSTNIRYCTTLFQLFPQAKIIHVVRDGRGVACSVLPLEWGPNIISKAAHYWTEKIAYGTVAESRWKEDRVLRVRYEDLVLESEVVLKRICVFLNIDYQPRMKKGDGFKPPAYTSEQHSLVGREPDSDRVNAWKRELTPRQIEIFESITDELLNYLGYEIQYGLKARGITRTERLLSHISDIYRRKIINRRKYRQRRRLITE